MRATRLWALLLGVNLIVFFAARSVRIAGQGQIRVQGQGALPARDRGGGVVGFPEKVREFVPVRGFPGVEFGRIFQPGCGFRGSAFAPQ